jgi:glutamyl-tRNA synthetase
MREEQQARKEPARYDRHCLYLPASEVRDLLAARTPHTVRLKMPDDGEATFTDMIRGTVTFRYELMDDQILMKSDGFPTYQLAAIVDDHLMEITHVIRGEEWISSVPKHLALFAAFGWQVPQYAHLPLLRNRDRSKMSKRKNPTSILWYREQGYLPDALVNFMGLMGWSHPDGREVFDRGEMVKHLRLEQISLGGPIFDFQKLDWMNGVYIRKLTTQELSRLCRPYLPQHLTDEQIEVVLPLVHERLKRLSEVSDFTSFFWPEHLDYDPTLLQVKGQSPEDVRGALENVLSALEDYQYPDHTTWEAALRSIAARRGMKDGDLFMLVRVAVTGRVASPPLYETSVALGWPLTRQRIKEALAKIP